MATDVTLTYTGSSTFTLSYVSNDNDELVVVNGTTISAVSTTGYSRTITITERQLTIGVRSLLSNYRVSMTPIMVVDEYNGRLLVYVLPLTGRVGVYALGVNAVLTIPNISNYPSLNVGVVSNSGVPVQNIEMFRANGGPRAYDGASCYCYILPSQIPTTSGTVTPVSLVNYQMSQLTGYTDVTVSPYGVSTDVRGTSADGSTIDETISTQKSYNMQSARVNVVPPELYFSKSANDQNILHVPMESTTGTVITGESQSVQIPSSALLEVAQPKAPADVTIKYSGTSVPVVSNTPVSRSRKKVT